MFEQKFINTNEILQCRILHYAKSAPPNSADLNTARQGEERIEKRGARWGLVLGVTVRICVAK
jgi:hypothetical protein